MSDELKRQLRERAAIHKQLQSRGQRAEPWPALFSRAHDRIEKLEAKLITAEQRGYANAMEAERKLHEGRIEELKGKLAKAVEALEYADRMVRIDLFRMTDFNCEDFSQAVVDTGERIKATLAELNCDERSGVATVSEAESEKKGETDD